MARCYSDPEIPEIEGFRFVLPAMTVKMIKKINV
jgi:hypothetical protein